MEIVAALLCVVLIFMINAFRNSFNDKISSLERQINDLKYLLKTRPEPDKKVFAEKPPQPAAEQTSRKPIHVEEITKPKSAEPEKAPSVTPELPRVIDQPVKVKPEPVMASITAPPVVTLPKWLPKKEPEPELSFFERYPDIEKFIGENLINKIGIAILVLAIGFFVKYAIDANWIGPAGRVGIGFICGGILIGFAHKLRKSYNAFSSVLVGGGLAVFYFTITLAFHQFNLFNQTTAFIILVIITAFAVALSLLYNRQELAVIALIGGLASPFMASTGNANYHALFIYMLVLNSGLLIIAYNKAWRILNLSAFALSQLVFLSVVFTQPVKDAYITMLYGGIFYLLYFLINIANNTREGKKFIASDFCILLTNTAIYFSAGLYLLGYMELPQYRGLFSVSMGVINLVTSFILLRNKKIDTNVLYLLIGITITFISLTAPIQLHGNNITLFWASEAVLLYWLYQRSKIDLMRYTALGIWVIMLISLGMDVCNFYFQIYDRGSGIVISTIMANKGFVTMLYAAFSTYALYILVGRDTNETADDQPAFRINKVVFGIIALVILFLSGLLEVNYQFQTRYPEVSLNIMYSVFYISAFVLSADIISFRFKQLPLNAMLRFCMLAVTIVIYLLYTANTFNIQIYLLTLNTLKIHFITHWLNAIIIGCLFLRLINLYRESEFEYDDPFSWITALGVVVFLSFEINLLANTIFYSNPKSLDVILETYIQTCLPVLWGLCSFAFMWLGMRYKYKPLRIISLTLFSITLLKLFIFDLRNIPAAGKIVAFFCLGMLLLIISFMYQKVKKIIIADEEPPAV